MLRALFFILRTALLVAAAVWVANRPGTITLQWLGYDVEAHVGFALLIGFVFLLLVLFVARLVWNLMALPGRMVRALADRRRRKGYRAMTLGLTAIAAGDSRAATQQAVRARRYLPEERGLSVLLEAQAARLRGDDAAARVYFDALMQNRDTAFLGLRGLLLTALERNDLGRAHGLAQQALALHPRQPWVLRMAYDLELRLGRWEEARRILDRAARLQAFEPEKISHDRAAILLQQGGELLQDGHTRAALDRLKRAHKVAPDFVPAALRLAQHYIDRHRRRSAAIVLEKTWKQNPHPELVPLWRDAMPQNKNGDTAARMNWIEDLADLRADSIESHLAVATDAIDLGLWGVARQSLEKAESLGGDARMWRLRARLAQKQNRPEEAALMLRKAADAPAAKVWVCRDTGRIYDRWVPFAELQGSFNTIVWGHPHFRQPDRAIADRSELLITAPVGT